MTKTINKFRKNLYNYLTSLSVNKIYKYGNTKPIGNEIPEKAYSEKIAIPLTPSLLFTIFDLYDQKIFDNQIKNKLGDMGKKVQFYLADMTSLEKNRNIIILNGDTFKIYISQNIVIGGVKLDISSLPKNLTERRKISQQFSEYVFQIYKLPADQLSSLLITIENIIIELLLILWNYINEDDEKFSSQGRLFLCMMNEYFHNQLVIPSHKIEYIVGSSKKLDKIIIPYIVLIRKKI